MSQPIKTTSGLNQIKARRIAALAKKAGKLANSSFRNALPIHLDFIWNPKNTYFVGVAVDYNESAVYYINGVQNGVQYGPILNQSNVYDLLALRNGSYDLNQVLGLSA